MDESFNELKQHMENMTNAFSGLADAIRATEAALESFTNNLGEDQ